MSWFINLLQRVVGFFIDFTCVKLIALAQAVFGCLIF